MPIDAGEGEDQIRPPLADKGAGRGGGDRLDIAYALHGDRDAESLCFLGAEVPRAQVTSPHHRPVEAAGVVFEQVGA